MAILDIQLNAVSVVNLIMSLGIAVEFCVHITHAYLVRILDFSWLSIYFWINLGVGVDSLLIGCHQACTTGKLCYCFRL